MAPIIVFDLGEVLVPSTGVLPALAAELDVAVERLVPAYWRDRLDHDRGSPAEVYWAGVLGALDRVAEPGIVAQLRDVDSAKWSTLPAAGRDLLAAAAGRRVGVLSNAPAPLAAAVRAAPWSAAVDVLVFSADLGLVKPEPEIYVKAAEAYGAEPGEVVFFDDRPANVDAARAQGWDAHVFTGPATVLDILGSPGGRTRRAAG